MSAPRPSANLTVALACAAGAAGMVAAAYASVPLYELFCKVTGYGGTTRVAESVEGIAVVDREITVRFDTNVAPGLPWKFYPAERQVTLKLGEVGRIAYYAENNSDAPLAGMATYNVTPQQFGAYFNKLECFCFTQTEVGPGERLEMPVVFFVDPQMLDAVETRDIRTVTLSYTFFPSQGEPPLAADRPADEAAGG